MSRAITLTILFSLILPATIFASQEPTMKRQGPTMTSAPVMRPAPMMKKAAAAPVVKAKRKGARKHSKKTPRNGRRTS